MRILVTGGAGFIGSHVVDTYVQAGHEVWVLDDLSRGKREQVNSQARFVQMDLRSPALRDLLAEVGFDCINHHAAQIDVRVSVADPAHDAMINVAGTLNLLEAARAHGVPRVIFASTGGAIYGEQRHFPANEQHPTAPLSPYGVTKLAVEHYLEYYRQVHGLRYAVLRYANVYGPRQDPEGEAGVVAIFCARILGEQQLTIYGDGQQTRDYVYVGDVARANLLALRHLSVESFESVASIASGIRTRSRLNNSTDPRDTTDPMTQRTHPPIESAQSIASVGSGVQTRSRPNNSTDPRDSTDSITQRTHSSIESAQSIASVESGVQTRSRLNNSTDPRDSKDSITQRTQETQQTQGRNNGKNVFNIGTGIETSVNALASMLLVAADADTSVQYAPARAGEQARSAIDSQKAAQVLGWRPTTSLADGLLQTLAWFRAQHQPQVSARSD